MKVWPEKLTASFQERVYPIYIVSGDEPLLVQECTDDIREGLKAAGYLQRDLFHAEGKFDWKEVLFSANSMSLFAEQKIIEVRMSSSKAGDASATLVEYASSPPEDTVLLLVMPRIDGQTQKAKWFKALDSVAAFTQVWPIETAKLPGWLSRRCQRIGLRATKDAMLRLADKTEGNLLAAVQEIELLRLMATDGMIDEELVTSGVADSARFDVFAMIDAALSGDAGRTLKIAKSLESEDEPIVAVNGMVARELRSLDKIAADAEISGVAAAMKKHRVWPKRQDATGRVLKRGSRALFERLETRVAQVDGMAKGFVDGDPWQELQRVMLELAGQRVLT